MSQDLEISILGRARAFLGVDDSATPDLLYSRLRDYRVHIHPDKFDNEEQKKTAQGKFQEVQELLEGLARYIRNIELNRAPSELVLFEPEIERIHLMREIDSLKEEIEAFKTKLKDKDDEVEGLTCERDREKERALDFESQLNDRAQQSLKLEAQEIENLYRPTLQTFAPAGIAIFVAAALSVMTKIEEGANLIQKYSPFPEQYVAIFAFSASVLSVFWTLKQFIESSILRRLAREVVSPHFCEQFLKHLELTRQIDPAKVNKFTERDVFSFIRGKVRWWHKILATLGFHIYQIETPAKLTDYFLATLLTKKLIGIADAEFLDRSFVIKTYATRFMF